MMPNLNGYEAVAKWLGILHKGRPSERGLLQAMDSGSKSRFRKARTWDTIERYPHMPTVHDIAERLHIPPLAVLCILYPVDADDVRYIISALKEQGITAAELSAAVDRSPAFNYVTVRDEPDRAGIAAALQQPERETYRAIAAKFGVSPDFVRRVNDKLRGIK